MNQSVGKFANWYVDQILNINDLPNVTEVKTYYHLLIFLLRKNSSSNDYHKMTVVQNDANKITVVFENLSYSYINTIIQDDKKRNDIDERYVIYKFMSFVSNYSDLAMIDIFNQTIQINNLEIILDVECFRLIQLIKTIIQNRYSLALSNIQRYEQLKRNIDGSIKKQNELIRLNKNILNLTVLNYFKIVSDITETITVPITITPTAPPSEQPNEQPNEQPSEQLSEFSELSEHIKQNITATFVPPIQVAIAYPLSNYLS